MSYFADVSLLAGITTIVLGFVVFYFNRKSFLNKLFFIMSAFGFLYAFANVMMWQSGTFESASFWSKAGFVWVILTVLVFHFALAFTQSSLLKNKYTYIGLYGPAVIFAAVELFTYWDYEPPVLKYWGYNAVASGSWVFAVITGWMGVLTVSSLILCYRYYSKASDIKTKFQRRYVCVGFSIPIATFIVTNILFRIMSVEVPNLGFIATLFFSCFIGFAILKHDLFFDVSLAAESMMNTMPDSLILTDVNGFIIKVNQAQVDLAGYPANELVGRSIINLFSVKEQGSEVLENLLASRKLRNVETRFKTNTGDEKFVLFSGSVVSDKRKRDIGLTCVAHDITDLKKMEDKLVKAEKLAAIGQLAGQIGHDLRNPLSGIKGGVYFLRKKGNTILDSDRIAILDTIDSAIDDSNRIINGLIDYSSELRLHLKHVTSKTVLTKALNKTPMPNNIVIEDCTTEEFISVDSEMLERVFCDIINNSIDAMPSGGKIKVQNVFKEKSIEITFTDTGRGIPGKVMGKMFSPLNTTKAKGMGLSLAICKRIIEAHNGKISIESLEGKGTTVIITLPIRQKQSLNMQSDSNFSIDGPNIILLQENSPILKEFTVQKHR